MKERFEFLMDEYLKEDTLLIDSSKDYYIKFVKEIPEYLYKYFDKKKYLIKASIGAGQKSEIPWVCIFNRSVTETATQGIYIVYLFRKDMSGFYLELGQGITTFENLYGADKYKNVIKVANYFKDLISDDSFSKESIDLKGLNKLAKGYECGTILSKYYEKDKYTENELLKDLSDLKTIYDDICDNLMDDTYMNIVNNVIDNMNPYVISAKEANAAIETALLEENELEEAEVMTLEYVDIPNVKKKNKYSVIKQKTVRKIDHLKKARSSAKIGLLGEDLVMAYEKDRLTGLGREDLADRIKWISKEDDTTGYDIISFDVDKNGDVVEKYIEVKTTEGNDTNIFFVSANEVKTMDELKNKYYIYRVFNLKSKNPKVYVLDYNDFKNKIELSVDTYLANLREE